MISLQQLQNLHHGKIVSIKISDAIDDSFAGKIIDGIISSVNPNEDRGNDVAYYDNPANYRINLSSDNEQTETTKIYSVPVDIIDSVEVKTSG
jgi:hypothetical protein